MIRVTDKSKIVTLFFNKLNNQKRETNTITLYGIGDQYYKISNENQPDLGDYDNFYVFQVSLENIPDGEYKWIVNDYEQGLMIIGDLDNYITAPEDKDEYTQDQKMTDYVQFD